MGKTHKATELVIIAGLGAFALVVIAMGLGALWAVLSASVGLIDQLYACASGAPDCGLRSRQWVTGPDVTRSYGPGARFYGNH